MAKKKNQKKAEAQAKKSAVESLRFQAHWGLKQRGCEDDMFHKLVDAEVEIIAELELAQDMLAIKALVDDVKQAFGVTSTPEKGNLTKSPTAVALGIAYVEDMNIMGNPLSWNEMKEQKLLKIYYPEEYRNQIINWAKQKGFNTSTYLGMPMIKFSHIFLVMDRTKEA